MGEIVKQIHSPQLKARLYFFRRCLPETDQKILVTQQRLRQNVPQFRTRIILNHILS